MFRLQFSESNGQPRVLQSRSRRPSIVAQEPAEPGFALDFGGIWWAAGRNGDDVERHATELLMVLTMLQRTPDRI